jgi:hypothetical protein
MDNLISAGVDVGIIVGLTQVVKLLGLPTRYIPLTALVIGVCWAFLSIGVSTGSTVAGIIAGLVSVGLFSGTRATLGK